MVVPGENARIVVDGRFFIFRLFDAKFGFKSTKLPYENYFSNQRIGAKFYLLLVYLALCTVTFGSQEFQK
jgi:hypothetical protein